MCTRWDRSTNKLPSERWPNNNMARRRSFGHRLAFPAAASPGSSPSSPPATPHRCAPGLLCRLESASLLSTGACAYIPGGTAASFHATSGVLTCTCGMLGASIILIGRVTMGEGDSEDRCDPEGGRRRAGEHYIGEWSVARVVSQQRPRAASRFLVRSPRWQAYGWHGSSTSSYRRPPSPLAPRATSPISFAVPLSPPPVQEDAIYLASPCSPCICAHLCTVSPLLAQWVPISSHPGVGRPSACLSGSARLVFDRSSHNATRHRGHGCHRHSSHDGWAPVNAYESIARFQPQRNSI